MPIAHYLDTARLGLMTPTAAARHRDLLAFAAARGASVETDALLAGGGAALPAGVAARHPDLIGFPGVAGLRDKLADRLGGGHGRSVLLASHSAAHARVAASLLFGPCRRVLTTDLSWPPFRRTLERAAARGGRKLVVLPVRELLGRNRPTPGQLADHLRERFRSMGCDGLFLTAVSHDGLRLPAAETVAAVRRDGSLKFAALDGAQEFGQVDHRATVAAGDFYLTGGHKWLGGFVPLSVAVYGRARSAGRVERVVADGLDAGAFDDPLTRLAWAGDGGVRVSAESTANVAALFACDGALDDLAAEEHRGDAGAVPLTAAEAGPLLDRLRRGGRWAGRDLPAGFGSRTLLLEPSGGAGGREETRRRFAAAGLAVTAYDGGSVRLSVPRGDWEERARRDVTRRLLSV